MDLKPYAGNHRAGGDEAGAERMLVKAIAILGGQWAFVEIGGKLGVPLPAQRARAAGQDQMAGAFVRRGNAGGAGEVGEDRMIDGKARLGHERDLHQQARG